MKFDSIYILILREEFGYMLKKGKNFDQYTKAAKEVWDEFIRDHGPVDRGKGTDKSKEAPPQSH